MLSFPNCKINLGLHILRKRADGFHDLETVFYPVGLNDALEAVASGQLAVGSRQLAVASGQPAPDSYGDSSEQAATQDFIFSQSGLLIDGKPEDNLCYKAYHLLKNDFSNLPAVKMHLHKQVPMGAGLGGGSADAAFCLKLLNDKFKLDIAPAQLLKYAAVLGSDAPFFIINKPCFATGRGEILEPVDLDLSEHTIVLVNPRIHINTGWAFSQLSPHHDRNISLKEIIQQPISNWKDQLINDFEEPVFKLHPSIEGIKKTLYDKGALYAAMSGSGSTLFGIFKKEEKPAFDFPGEYFVRAIPG